MITLTGIRFLIEFSSILVLAFLCIMHEFTDVTFAKQFNIDHASNHEANFDDVEPTSLHLSPEDDIPFIRFSPESLDFGHHPISMPVIETVYVHNRHDDISIQMISISGNTEHFHCSFFEDKVVPPRSNTSFQVVFLARQEGLVNNTLYIHSSVGSFHYRVSALGEASPFRVRPLIGAKVPLNASFASLIYIYNPFSTPLQLTEMYTSGGGLHLELPDDEYEAPSSLWKVPPYETRPVMKAHFVARIASNHTSYIRIRTNATDVHLMLPVEVEVSNSPGLYSPLDTLDFGVLRSRHDPPKVLPIQVINAAMKTIHVQSIEVLPHTEGLSVDFEGPVKLPPRTSSPFHIANLVLDPSQFSCTGLCIGSVVVKSKNNHYKLSIPFVVRLIKGELYIDDKLSHFFINQSSSFEQKEISVENRFDAEIVVHEISLPDEAKPYFKLTIQPPHKLPVVLPIGKPFPLLNLEFTPSPQLSHFSTTFRLLTNFSYFDLPLYAYRGKLDLFIPSTPDQTKLDLGLVGLNEQKSSTFVLSNHNPISIRIVYWHCNLTGVSVEFVGTSQGNISAIKQKIEPSGLPRSGATLLAPNHSAVFRVHVNRFSKEGTYNGTISLSTPFETLSVPLLFTVLRGSLTSTKVVLPKTFPGRIASTNLNIISNYTSEIKLKGAFVEPEDDRFQIKLDSNLIKPGENNQIQILFDASAKCFQRICYAALDIEKEVGHLWLLGTGLYSDTAYIDKELYKLLRNQWLLLSESDRNPAVNIRLQVDGFGSFITEAQAQLCYPRLSNKLSIRFPSVRIGRTITKELMVENPADRPILVQAIDVGDYPNSDILLQLISNEIFHQQWSRSDLESIEDAIRTGHNTSSAFMLSNTSSTTAINANRINEWLGVAPDSNSYTIFLPPGARQRLTVSFHPIDEKNFTSLLILRNNLTIIEVVMLRGEGGRGLLKIGKTLPNDATAKLKFEFPERILEKKCRLSAPKSDGDKSTVPPPLSANSLVIKEKFRTTNVGRMGLQIRGYLIDGMPCEGYGFRVSHCEPTFLMPNQSFDIEMVYSPDFTQTEVNHDLLILVDDDNIHHAQRFQLEAKLPQKLLKACLKVLPRPQWESFIYYLLVLMALFVLFLSIVVAISDAHRITFNPIFRKQTYEDQKTENSSPNRTANSSTDATRPITPAESVANSSHVKQSQNGQQNGLNKVRNRRGNKNGNQINNPNRNNASNSKPFIANGHVQHQPSNDSKSESSTVKNKDNEQPSSTAKNTNSPSPSTEADSPNWSNSMRKKLLRQDSSSSELSQRSSDNSSTSSNKNVEKDSPLFSRLNQKKANIDSSVESLAQSDKASPIVETKPVKPKEHEYKKSIDYSKTIAQKKSNKNVKQSKSPTLIQKTPKSLEKASSVDVSKSSSESLNSGAKADSDLTTKARSATLPLFNDSKISLLNESVSISQSDFSSNNVFPNISYETGQTSVISRPNKSHLPSYGSKSSRAPIVQERNENLYRSNYRNDFPRLSDTDIQNENVFYENRVGRTKDIWDLPITNFDSELAMNLLVKQTEEFATASDEKLSFPRNNSNRRLPLSPERNNYFNNNNNSVTRLSDDKWEIGEWSNELAATSLNKHKGQDHSTKFTSNRNIFSANEFNQPTKQSRYNNRAMQYSNKDVYDRAPESMFPSNSNRPNSFVKNPNFGPALSKGSSNSNSSLASNSSSTFSPVIGRPTSTTSPNGSIAVPPSAPRPSCNSFGLNSPLDFNFPLIDSIFSPATTNPPPGGVLSDSKQNLQNLFSSEAWNKNTLDNTPFGSSSSFLDPLPTKPINSSIFNFDSNDNAWSTTWSNFSSSAINNNTIAQSSSTNTFSSSNNTVTNLSHVSSWPTCSTSSAFSTGVSPPPPTSVGSSFLASSHLNNRSKLNPSPTSANHSNSSSHNANQVWSSFDSYVNSASLNPTVLPGNGCTGVTSASIGGSGRTSENSIFEGASSVFELFGGSSPWSPLGTNVDTAATASPSTTAMDANSSMQLPSHTDPFVDHFSATPSPVSRVSTAMSSSSSNSASTSPVNQSPPSPSNSS